MITAIKNLLPICFLFVTIMTNGQQKNTTNSENNKLKKTLSTSHQIELEDYQVMLDTISNPIDSATVYNNIAIVHLKSTYYLVVPKYDSIHYYGNKALLLTKNSKTTKGIQQYLMSIGLIAVAYMDTGFISKALENFNEILNITENISNPSDFYERRQAATTYIASFYAAQENFQLAIDQYNSLFDYVKERRIDEEKISSIVFLKYARFHRNIGMPNVALKYANKAKEVATKNNYDFRVAMTYLELAFIKLESHEIKKAKVFLAKAFELLKNPEYIGLLSDYYYIKSLIAGRNANLSEKIYNAGKAFELLNKQTISKKHIIVGNILYGAYKEKKDFQKAMSILEEVSDLEKILSNSEEIKKSTLQEIERRDQNIVFEQTKNKTKSNIIVIITLLFSIGILGTVYIFKDRQKKIKLALEITEKNEQLMELDKVKSHFFANISHELQTPLTLIAGPVDQVLKNNTQKLDIATKSKLQMVLNNTDTLKTLINDVLDLTKLKAKKLKLNLQPTDLDTFCNSMMQKFLHLVKEKDISFHYCFKDLEDVHAILDSNKLEKILTNLLSNAIKYTPAKGSIFVTGTLKKKQLQIVVKDTGVGISATDVPLVFNRYFQSNDATKPLEGGSSIGLSLVKELIELMDGKIKAQSELGKGSTFTMTIPIKKTRSKTLKHYKNTLFTDTEISLDHLCIETVFDVKQHTILIVEDHTEMQQFITSILQNRYKLLVANNGKDALEKLQSNHIDLIISDVMMPVMDGFTFLETVKESKTYANVPIVMLTALSELNLKLKALTIGADDYLTKPFMSSELLARTYNLLERYGTLNQVKTEITAQEDILEALLTTTGRDKDVLIDMNMSTGTATKTDVALINKVAEIIEKNMGNSGFKLHDLGEELHLGERQLRRKIKLITGLSPKKFQQEVLLLKARTLLEESVYCNTKAVSLSVGMDNTTRFGKLYEARFGKHPAAYFNA